MACAGLGAQGVMGVLAHTGDLTHIILHHPEHWDAVLLRPAQSPRLPDVHPRCSKDDFNNGGHRP